MRLVLRWAMNATVLLPGKIAKAVFVIKLMYPKSLQLMHILWSTFEINVLGR